MINEHDITKKMLNLIREATMTNNVGTQNTNQQITDVNQETSDVNNIENGEKIVSIDIIEMKFSMDNIIYTFNSDSDEITINTGSDEVSTSSEYADNIKKLNDFFKINWKPKWFDTRINDVKHDKKGEEIFIVKDGNKNSNYDYIYNEDLGSLKTIDKSKNVQILEYKFKLK